MLPFILPTVRGLAAITAEVRKTGERAHVGLLLLAKLTSSVQMVSLPALCTLVQQLGRALCLSFAFHK